MKDLKINQIVNSIKNKDFSAKEITEYFVNKALDDQNKGDKSINAFISISKDNALKQAEKIDEKIKAGENLPLMGVPLAIKDNINVKDMETTCASKILKGYVSTYNAHVIDKLINSGAIITGKLNMDEFAMGSSNETSAFGVCRNPHNIDYIPGGSSGGPAAAVAASLVPGSLGSDTGGSIRLPASLCGVVGLKPTYGRVSRYGLVAYGSSLDQIGPIAKSVDDISLLLSTISGYDNRDSTSVNLEKEDFNFGLDNPIKGKKIGVPKEFFIDGLSEDVKKTVTKSIETLKLLGCEIIDINLPHTKYGVPVYYIIATSEASSNLARFDGIRYGQRVNADELIDVYMNSREKGFGEEVKRRIMIGTYSLSSGYYDAYYLKALKVRTLIKNDFLKAFEKVDAILSPVSPTPAFKIGEKIDDPVKMYLSDIFTITANLAGIPAISLPVNKNKEGLPIGIQLLSGHFKEKLLLNISKHFENAIEYDYNF